MTRIKAFLAFRTEFTPDTSAQINRDHQWLPSDVQTNVTMSENSSIQSLVRPVDTNSNRGNKVKSNPFALLPPPPNYNDIKKCVGKVPTEPSYELYTTRYDNGTKHIWYANEYGLKNPLGMDRENAFVKHD